MTPTLTMFSKNEDNKHKSLRSKQELSAFNAKKKKIKEILRQILLTLHMGWTNLELLTCLQRSRSREAVASPGLCVTAEAVGVFLFGGYIQTHPRLMYFYTCMYTKATTLSLWKPPAPPREAGCQPLSHCHC